MKKTLILAVVCLAVFFVPYLPAQSTEDLQKEIELLKAQLQSMEQVKAQLANLEAKVAAMQAASAAPAAMAAPAVPAATQAQVDELDTRLSKVETKSAQDRISWGGDVRVRLDNQHWSVNPYMQFMGMETPPVQVPAQSFTNDMQWGLRLRLKLNANITDNLTFMGRLSMQKLYGGADVPIFNGFPNTVANSFNSVRISTSDVLHVERALLKYDIPNVPLTFAIGRMNTSDGPPLEIREETERQATPLAIMVNGQVDGMHLDVHLDDLGLPEGTTIGVCGGIGYESGFGGGGNVSSNMIMTPFGMGHIAGMKDSAVLGLIYDMPFMFETGSLVNNAQLFFGYNHFYQMTDIPYGSLINFPIPGAYAQPSPQYVTATNNLGDMDQLGWCWEHQIGDKFTYFYSGGYILSHPNGKVSQYGFGGLLGNPFESESGTAHYVGGRFKPIPVVSLGLEFNHGSPNWWTYSPATGESTEKLAARGNVWEGYVHWTFTKNTMLKAGYIHYDYSTAFSGWHIAPGPLSYYNLDNTSAVNFYPFPKSVQDVYLMLETRW